MYKIATPSGWLPLVDAHFVTVEYDASVEKLILAGFCKI